VAAGEAARKQAKELWKMGEDTDTDDLLDVFTSVEVAENPISIISRELSDVSIDSLLDQTREIAVEIKRGR
jgi:ribosomal protein L12E/L44/L45/RPP1/RPP2